MKEEYFALNEVHLRKAGPVLAREFLSCRLVRDHDQVVSFTGERSEVEDPEAFARLLVDR